MIKRILLLCIFFLNIFYNGLSQKDSDFFFAPPLDIPLKISGNFGDVRASSFHFGLDFRTEETTGFPVYAIADGWIARVKVEPGGYGRALYINHPNGTTSVYAHLESILGPIAQFVKNEQYKRESFYVDLTFTENQFTVKKCDIIGKSGNAGLSSGPHMHFEIRETETQTTTNCFRPEFPMIDEYIPTIGKIWIYPPLNYFTDESIPKQGVSVKSKNGKILLDENDTILVPSVFGLGMEAFDNVTDNIRKLSFYSAKLFDDSTLMFHIQFDMLSFDQMSYVNSIIDFEQKKVDNTNIYKLLRLPNQNIKVIKYAANNGYIHLIDSLVHKIKIIVSDINGNSTNLTFYVRKSETWPAMLANKEQTTGEYFKWNEKRTINLGQCRFEFPVGTFYQDVCIGFKKVSVKSKTNFYSGVYRIGENTIPTKAPFKIYFSLGSLSENLKSKMVIVSVTEKGNIAYAGGTIENGYISTSLRTFGSYALTPDTVAPQIVPQNISKNKNMLNENEIRIKIDDNLSGVGEYRGTIDGKWVLFEYDLKNDLLVYKFDPTRIVYGNQLHRLNLVVKDRRENKKTYSVGFFK